MMLLVPALAAGLLLAGCGGESEDPQDAVAADRSRVLRVETLVLEPTDFQDVVQLTAAVEALEDATLSAQSAGTVTHLAPLGAHVPAGGLVAQLDPGVARSAVAQAEAAVEAAQAAFDLARENLNRNEPLYRDSVISAIEWENVRAQYNQAQAELSRAKATLAQANEQLAHTRVTSPFSGTVEEHFVELGEQVTPSVPVARVINTGRVKVVAGVPERYAADIEVGTPVTVNFQAYGGEEITSEVSFVGRAINPDSRTFPIEIILPNPGDLKPEMVAQVRVARETIEDAIVVPRSAVIRTEEGTHVFLVDQQDGRPVAVRRDVVLGAGHGGNVVASNLQPGDEVVVLGQTNLTEGDPVQVMSQYDDPDEAGLPLTDSTTIGE